MLVNDVMEVYKKSDRIIRVKVACYREIVSTISAYEPKYSV